MTVTIGDSGLCCTCVTYFGSYLTPCVLILHKNSGPRSVSDQLYNYIMARHQVHLDIPVQFVMTKWEINVEPHKKYRLGLVPPRFI